MNWVEEFVAFEVLREGGPPCQHRMVRTEVDLDPNGWPVNPRVVCHICRQILSNFHVHILPNVNGTFTLWAEVE